ncbi:hypothetical protein ABE493_00360 [Stenotrophomonas terrae]|uniref:hypothetical protein n=1 Tax=Stenotrophomonas terrae TaxID=405446 RepID=UPI0032095EF6
MDGFLEYLHRFASDLFGRTDGPMTFRFFLQPTMAFLAALHDGIKDAKLGRSPYMAGLLSAPHDERNRSFREGVTAVTRVLLLGVVMDVIYQFKVYGAFKYPLETFVLAVLLAFIPYLVLRGPVARVAKWWNARKEDGRNP